MAVVVCASPGAGRNVTANARTKPVAPNAARLVTASDRHAAKARAISAVRLTSEAVKANHRQGKPARGLSRAAAAR